MRLLGCVQSQDAPLAAWSLGMRMRPGTTYADVLAEQSAGGWLRTHVLRPTWHLLAPEDLRWMQGVTGPRVEGAMAGVNAATRADRRGRRDGAGGARVAAGRADAAHPARGARWPSTRPGCRPRCSTWRTC